MPEDFNKLRLMVHKLVTNPWQRGWQWRVTISDFTPEKDFDIYMKDVSYGPITILTEQVRAGMHTITYPYASDPVGITCTMRDNQDRIVYNFCQEWAAKVMNSDGTVNLPSSYCKTWTRYNLLEAAKEGGSQETKSDEWKVYITNFGDLTESKEEDGILEFPVVLMQFYA